MLIGYSTLKVWRRRFKELKDILPNPKEKLYTTDGSQAKAYLNRFKNRWIQKAEMMENLNNSRIELLDKATKTTSRLNPVRVQTSYRNDKLERCVIDAESLAEKIRATAAMIQDEKSKVYSQIQKVTIQPEHDLLVNVILQGKSLSSTANEIGITRDSGKYHLNKAFQEFEKVNPDLFG